MWLVIKYNTKEINNLKTDLKNRIGGDPIYFQPKLMTQKVKKNRTCVTTNFILGDYIICFHEKFNNLKNLYFIKNCKGIKYILENSINAQKDILNFINYCKKHEEENGFISPGFFQFVKEKKGQFVSGPFTNMFFKVLEERTKKLQVLIGGFKTTIKKNSNNSYLPV